MEGKITTLQPKKLGHGLQGSGKRTAVPSVFTEYEDELQKKKKMRLLVPIDYTTEEQMGVHSPMAAKAPASNPVVAPDFSRRGSGGTSTEEQMDVHSPMAAEAPASNPVAAPDFSRRGLDGTSKEERVNEENERSRGMHDSDQEIWSLPDVEAGSLLIMSFLGIAPDELGGCREENA